MLPPFVQWIIVGVCIAAAVFFIWRLLRRTASSCGDCPIKDACKKPTKR